MNETNVNHGRPGMSRGFVLVALGAGLWGTDAVFRRGLALELPASVIVFLEHAFLVAVMTPVLWRYRAVYRAMSNRDWLFALIIGGGSSTLATILFTAAFRYGDPTTPLLLQKIQPLVVVVAAALILGERIRPRFGRFLVSGMIGAWLVAFADPLGVSVSALTPALLAAGAAVLWGMGTVLGRGLSTHLSFHALTALRFGIGLPVAAVIVFVRGEQTVIPQMTGGDLWAIVVLSLVPGLAALLLYYRGLSSTTASAATVAELSFPLVAIVLNRIVFDASLTTTQVLGTVLLAGTILVMSGLSARRPDTLGVELVNRAQAVGEA